MPENVKYNRIKAALADQGLASKDLAVRIGVNPVTVSRWCTNSAQPSIEQLFRIAEVLEIDARELLTTRIFAP